MPTEEILDQPMFLKPHTELDSSPDNLCFYFIPPRIISDEFTIIRDLCRFLQLRLISITTFNKKLGFLTVKHERTYKPIMLWI